MPAGIIVFNDYLYLRIAKGKEDWVNMKKKKIILISISIAIIFFLFRIHYTKINKADQTEIINIDNIKTVKQIFNTNKKYIIQFSKKIAIFVKNWRK